MLVGAVLFVVASLLPVYRGQDLFGALPGWMAGLSAAIGIVLLGCAGANASWIYLVDQNPLAIYRAGYFLWLGSFALVGIGALLRARMR